MRARPTANLLVLAGYAAISFAFFGIRLLPDPTHIVVGTTSDTELYVWSFDWWPHAILHGQNPFVTHAIDVPDALNLAWTVSVPTLAVAFAPLTLLVGPVLSYDVAALLAPAVTAFTAFLLCRYLTRSMWAALVGGYLFGFSGSVLREQHWGNLHVTPLFVLPLVALVVLKHLRGELTRVGLALRLGLLLAVQLGISIEIDFSLSVALVVALLLAYAVTPDLRPQIRRAAHAIAGGYALGVVFAAPLVAYIVSGFVHESLVPVGGVGTDLLNLVVPTQLIAVGGSTLKSVSDRFPDGGIGAYLGLPMLAVIVAYLVRNHRTSQARVLGGALLVALLLALGRTLQVDGHDLMPMPWAALAHVPGFSSALPFRFSAYISLCAAVIVALWIGTTRGRVYRRPYLLPILSVAFLVPVLWQPLFRLKPTRLAFIDDKLYEHCLPRNEAVVFFPFGTTGWSMTWQSEAGFWFRIADGHLKAEPIGGKPLISFDADPIVHDFYFVDDGRPTMDSLLAFAANHDVGRVLAEVSYGYPSRTQMRRFGRVQEIGDLYVAPACGDPPLTTRDLRPYVQKLASGGNIGYCEGSNFVELPAALYPTGPLANASPANVIAGQGLTCAGPPAGFKRRGFATPAMGFPAGTYPYYAP
ncbi:MAG: hypothetical protein JOY72_12105 [Actinobacteria bacterium]|nr:hypothetical protein [Actinomycetota bacterium]